MPIEELKSSDVVDRARWYSRHQRPQDADSHKRFCLEVADEIERLRKVICKAGVFLDQKAPGLARDTLQELVTNRPRNDDAS